MPETAYPYLYHMIDMWQIADQPHARPIAVGYAMLKWPVVEMSIEVNDIQAPGVKFLREGPHDRKRDRVIPADDGWHGSCLKDLRHGRRNVTKCVVNIGEYNVYIATISYSLRTKLVLKKHLIFLQVVVPIARVSRARTPVHSAN